MFESLQKKKSFPIFLFWTLKLMMSCKIESNLFCNFLYLDDRRKLNFYSVEKGGP